jgi:streptogramin lyase
VHDARLAFNGLIASIGLLTACTGATHAAAPAGTTSTGLSPAVSSTPSASRVPNPFTVVGRYNATSLGLKDPANLAIGPDGNLYVTDASQHVTVISPHGKVLRRWGRPGKGPGQFSFIAREAGVPGVTAPIAIGADGRVYVVDTGNPRVEVFAPTGAFIRQFGSYGTGKGQFVFPSFIAVDRNGKVYVADDTLGSVSKFSGSGAFEWRIGGPSSNDPDLAGHFHLATVDAHGRLVTLNDDVEETLYIDARGRKVDAFDLPESDSGECDVTVDGTGNTYVNDCHEPLLSPHDTWVFDRSHHLIGEWKHSGFGYSPRFGPNEEVFTIAEDGAIVQLKVALPGA